MGSPTPIPGGLHVLVMNSPDPIAVQSLQVAQSTYNLTLAALIAAFVAIGVAFWALWIAINDARNNSTQLSIALRRPSLEVRFFEWPTSFGPFGVWSFYNRANAPILPKTLAVANDGSRTGHNVRVELFIDRKAVLRESISPHDDALVRGKKCYRQTFEIGLPIYCDAPPVTFNNDAIELANMEDVVIYWRVYDDYGTYPVDAEGRPEYGELHAYSRSRYLDEVKKLPDTSDRAATREKST